MKRFFLFILVGLLIAAWFRSHHGSMAAPGPAQEVGIVIADPAPEPPEPPAPGREMVEDLPVPIYPGTRVTKATIEPPTRLLEPEIQSREGAITVRLSHDGSVRPRTVVGQLSADETRAKADARKQLERFVAEWLVPEIPASWKPPAPLIDHLIRHVQIKPIVKDYGTLYEAHLDVNWTPEDRGRFLETYQHELVHHRMTLLGGILAFILTCLAALAGYIRADEATKGYYTNGLRLVAAAGVGAAGVVLYQLLA